MNDQDGMLRMLGIANKKKRKSFDELVKSIDHSYVEEIFEAGFECGAFNRANNRNVVRYDWKGKTYEISRFET